MSEAEEERKEVLLPFPEVYIKEEVKVGTTSWGDDDAYIIVHYFQVLITD